MHISNLHLGTLFADRASAFIAIVLLGSILSLCYFAVMLYHMCTQRPTARGYENLDRQDQSRTRTHAFQTASLLQRKLEEAVEVAEDPEQLQITLKRVEEWLDKHRAGEAAGMGPSRPLPPPRPPAPPVRLPLSPADATPSYRARIGYYDVDDRVPRLNLSA